MTTRLSRRRSENATVDSDGKQSGVLRLQWTEHYSAADLEFRLKPREQSSVADADKRDAADAADANERAMMERARFGFYHVLLFVVQRFFAHSAQADAMEESARLQVARALRNDANR